MKLCSTAVRLCAGSQDSGTGGSASSGNERALGRGRTKLCSAAVDVQGTRRDLGAGEAQGRLGRWCEGNGGGGGGGVGIPFYKGAWATERS